MEGLFRRGVEDLGKKGCLWAGLNVGLKRGRPKSKNYNINAVVVKNLCGWRGEQNLEKA